MSGLPPPPNGQVLSLVSALSQTENHDLHVQAIRHRDEALSSSPESYGNLCLQLAFLMVGSDHPETLIQRIEPSQMELWRQTDMTTALRLQSDPNLWIPFGQMAGLVLKNALLRPPIQSTGRPLSLEAGIANHVKETLLYGLSLNHAELRNVISSIIATSSVSPDGIQPYLHIGQWPQLMPALLHHLQPNNSSNNSNALQGSLSAIRKMMEDGPTEIPTHHLDALVPSLLHLFRSNDEASKVAALQSLVACLLSGVLPSALVVQFSEYLQGLSSLASDPSPQVRKWVCRSINTLLECHTQYIAPQMPSICHFMLQSTTLPQNVDTIDESSSSVAMEACEFWLLVATLDESLMTSDMLETVERLLPQLIPVLLTNMVYSQEQRLELEVRNEMDMEDEEQPQKAMKPVFHRTKHKHDGQGGGGGGDHLGDQDVEYNGDYEDDEDEDDLDDEDNEWNLRKYAGASLDSLANLYGAGPILPPLLPAVQQGLSSTDPWIQEASILALGAIADGCRDEMSAHMGELYPYLMNLLATPETPQNLPQVKGICAWTVGRYASWAVEQVQTGAQGHLLAQMTEVFLQRLQDRNRRVQVAVGSGLGVLMETAGDLMAPYLEHIYPALVSAMSRYQGRSLIIIFDTLGIMADFCGPAIGERDLPKIYVPAMLHVLNGLLRHDPTDRTLLPLMESLGSVSLACGMNFQPYALETFDNAMAVIEQMQMILATSDDIAAAEEEADPIVCAIDLLDGLCEGLGGNFTGLVASSSRYSQHFTTVLHALCKSQVPGVRMSALALLGDLARNAPSLIEPALPQLLQEAIANLEPTQHSMYSSLCNNAAWAIGEICVQCGENSTPFEPFAAALMQKLIALLMGNGMGRMTTIPGLAENAAACAGRLANVNPNFVAPELPRFLMGWCDGMAKISDPNERRDAFTGFCKTVYANPQAIQQASAKVADAISSIIFAIVSWHVPPEMHASEADDFLSGDFGFQPFPPTEVELGNRLAQLMRDIRSSVGEDAWKSVEHHLPVNVRRLLREGYQL
jgi:transportin-1